MNEKQQKIMKPLSIILYIIGALLLIYGIYMIIFSVNYVQAYQADAAITSETIFQYVITSSVSYFAFGIIMISVGLIASLFAPVAAIENTPSTSADVSTSEGSAKLEEAVYATADTNDSNEKV